VTLAKSTCAVVMILVTAHQAGLDVDVLATRGSEPLRAVSSHPHILRHDIPEM